MDKIDHKSLLKPLYSPSAKEPVFADVPDMNFIMLDGKGNPNASQLYQDTVSALFQLSYAIKFFFKKSQGIDYSVMPLEGLWWVEDMSLFSIEDKDSWLWTMMIMQPEPVVQEQFEQQRQEVIKKKGTTILSNARFENYHEGFSVQMMHIGPYSAEGPNIARMHESARQNGYINFGKHHEIYLGDVRKTAPEKLKTVLRQPVKKI